MKSPRKRKTPRTDDNFSDIIRCNRLEYDKHLERCGKIYDQMQLDNLDQKIYNNLIIYAERLIMDRMLMILQRLNKSLSRIWILISRDDLTIFFGKKINIKNRPEHFRLFLNPDEDMTKVYVYGNFYIGSSLKNEYIFNDYESLMRTISDYILQNMKPKRNSIRKIKPSKRRGSSISQRQKPKDFNILDRKNSVPDLRENTSFSLKNKMVSVPSLNQMFDVLN